MLTNPTEVVKNLRNAILHLNRAHLAASESEDGRTGLSGPTRDIIFGLNTAVDALATLIEAAA